MSTSAHDLSAIFDEHVAEPFVNHVPTMIGGVGADEVADFYGKYSIGHWPDNTRIIPVCRTIGTDRVIDEMIMSFTHDIPMPTFLPNVAPTDRAVLLPVVVVMGFETDKVAYERIYWDQASLLVQVGLLDETLLPVTGGAQARKVLDKDLPANTLLKADQPGPPA